MKFAELLEDLKRKDPSRKLSEIETVIPGDFEVYTRSFRSGDEIVAPEDVRGKHWLGWLIAGRAEIYEVCSFGPASSAEQFGTYRPIRILKPGDVIGFFGLADAMLRDENIKRDKSSKTLSENPARPKEAWRISAGHMATLIAYKKASPKEPARYPFDVCKKIQKEYRAKFDSHLSTTGSINQDYYAKAFFPHMALHNYEMKRTFDKKTGSLPVQSEFVFVAFTKPPTKEDKENPQLYSWILRNAVEAAKPYRLCRNIYNDAFYRLLISAILGIEIGPKRGIKPFHREYLLSPFIEGVAQALDAYVHDDPMFFSHNWDWEQGGPYWVKDRERFFNSGDLMVAEHPSQKKNATAIYPIGIANYHVSKCLESEFGDTLASGMFENIGNYLYPEMNPAGCELYTDYAEAAVAKYFEVQEQILRHVYQPDLLKGIRALQKRVTVSNDYRGVGGRRILALEFAPEN